jgi:hypothetical protein
MFRAVTLVGCSVFLAVAGATSRLDALRQATSSQGPGSQEIGSRVTPAQPPSRSVQAVLNRYCVTCHNTRLKTAGLLLDSMSVERPGEHAEAWEKVIRKLRTGAMPPPGLPRPDESTTGLVVSTLAAALDSSAAASPNPGRITIHRLNRVEYTNAVRDLLALEIDGQAWLPADDADLGFDNMADILSVSPAFLDRALIAARKISQLAVGNPGLAPATETYTLPKMRFQDDRMSEDLPFGSRGGAAIRHYFPLHGEYTVKIRLRRQIYDYIRGLRYPQELEVRLDGQLIRSFTVGGAPGTPPPATFVGDNQGDREWEDYNLHADDALEVRFPAKAGTHVVGVSFVQARSERDGVLKPRPTGKLLAVAETFSSPSEAPEAAVEDIVIGGPFNGAIGQTPSRQRIFICHPVNTHEEESCSERILATLARRAFRRPVVKADLNALLAFYKASRADGESFEAGIERGIASVLVDPEFLFRIERDPATVAPGTVYRISDLELASRLSFFLWSSIPDDELLDVAAHGKLREPVILEQQVKRMLADSRVTALVENFAGQWLSQRDLQSVSPTPELFPEFDDNLREAFARETALFVESQLREDRSLVGLLDADYTFVNERLARHYGIPNVSGSRFRRVPVTLRDHNRGGLLGQGSILTVTAYPNRTSPVLRGHWLLENLLGSPPPDPPPNVPGLPESGEGGKPSSVRERLELHRKNPVCSSCHSQMDPLGFALENFDAVGMWRTSSEVGTPLDVRGAFPDGTTFEGVAGLQTVLLRHQEQYLETFVEKLLIYALGRGLTYHDMPIVRQIIRGAAPHNYSWSSVILAIVDSIPFQMRRSES